MTLLMATLAETLVDAPDVRILPPLTTICYELTVSFIVRELAFYYTHR